MEKTVSSRTSALQTGPTTDSVLGVLPNVDLVAATRRLVLEERQITAEILAHINEVARRRIYAELGFSSLFEWLTKDLKYSAAAAYRRIQAARLLEAVPDVSAKVVSGELNLTTLAQAQTAIRNEERRTGLMVSTIEKHNILCSIESSSSRVTEEVLAIRFPESAGRDVLEKVRSVGEEIVRVEVTMTKAQFRKIERARELTSHSKFGASMADIIEVLADDFLQRRDPLVKKSRATEQGSTARRETARRETAGHEIASQSETAAEAMRVNSFVETKDRNADEKNGKEKSREGRTYGRKRIAVKKSVRDAVFRRGNGACEFKVELKGNTLEIAGPSGGATARKCGSRHRIEVDHILPVALGGMNELENLRLLCRTHNLFEAERLLGRAHMQTFRR